MEVEFKTIKEYGKCAVEITDEGDGRFSIWEFEGGVGEAVISVTKEDVESMMSFINRDKKENK